MWPFRRRRQKEQRSDRYVKRIVTGLIIGGAIGSVIGKRLMDKHDEEMEEGDDDQD